MILATKLNTRAFDYGKELVLKGRVVFDERDAWSEHQPSAQEENEFIRAHGFHEYAKWHLGIDDEFPEDTNSRTVIFKIYTVVRCLRLRAVLDNISTSTSKTRQPTYTG
jgi:hypothetical protein